MLEFLNNFADIYLEMSPYLLLGFVIAGILNELFKSTKLKKYIGGKDVKSIINASLLGVPLPLCSCGVIPTGVSFHKSGASKGASVSFLISTPQTGVDSILVTWSLIGLPFAILRPVIALVTGVFGGILTNSMTKKEDGEKKEEKTEVQKDNRTFSERAKAAFKYAFIDFLDDISTWLFIGLFLAALITTLIPEDFFTTYLGNNFLSMLVVLVASVPLYICATSSVPIAAALMMKGLNPGAALVFLMAGPATNAATITVIGRSLGWKALTGYLVSIIGGALFFGAMIDLFLPAEWFAVNSMKSMHQHGSGFSMIFYVSGVVMAIALLSSFYRYFSRKMRGEGMSCSTGECNCEHSGNIVVKVEGMTCNHCKKSVTDAVSEVPGVETVEVDLATGNATIHGHDVDLELVKKAVEGRGFKFVG